MTCCTFPLSGSGGKRGRSTLGSVSSNSIGRDGGDGSRHSLSPRGSKERRRSAGDEQGMLAQLNMFVRTRTDSGKQLSDMVSVCVCERKNALSERKLLHGKILSC